MAWAKISTALLANACLAASLSAQWVPASAQVHEMQFRLNPDGALVILENRQGTYLRASDGSARTLLQRVSTDASSNAAEEILLDAPHHRVVRVSFDSKSYSVVGSIPAPFLPRTRSHVPQAILVSEQTINGLRCHGLPVKGDAVQSGTAWYSFENDLKVREETELSNGLHYFYELTNIHLGIEPPRSAFQIPAAFTEQ